MFVSVIGASDAFVLSGDGENEYGAFVCRGTAENGRLALVRTYVAAPAPPTPPPPPPDEDPTPLEALTRRAPTNDYARYYATSRDDRASAAADPPSAVDGVSF